MVTGGRTTGLLLRFDLSILADEESILNRSSIVSMDTRVEAASISLNSAEDIKDVWFLVVLFCRVGVGLLMLMVRLITLCSLVSLSLTLSL